MEFLNIFNILLSGLFLFNSGLNAIVKIYDFSFLLIVYLISILEINVIFYYFKSLRKVIK